MKLLSRQVVRPFGGRVGLSVLLVALLQVVPAGGADLSIIETVNLDFGSVVDDNGTVVLGLGDAIIADPDGIHVAGPVATGRYTISGDPFAAFSLSIAGFTAAGLTIGTFETSEGTPPLLSVALDGSGELDISLGATLTVDSGVSAPGLNQPLIYIITIDYN